MPTKLSRFCDAMMEAAWLAAVILAPVFFNIYSSRIFEPDKITIVRSLALLILGLWSVKLLDESRVRWDRLELKEPVWKFLLKFPMLAPVFVMTLVYLVSTILSVTPRASLWGSYQRLQGTYTTFSYLVIFAALLVNLRRKTQVQRLISVVIISSLPISLYGILQRYKLDPIPWGGDTTIRIASNMGNSIFVAAYLIMAFPLTVGRIVESFTAILKEQQRMLAHVARATAYVFIAALTVVAIYMSQSRGPALGWMAGIYFLGLLLSLNWRKRWLTFGIILASLLGAAFLIVFNIDNGPLESLRKSPAIGRFGMLLDEESNSARVRKYIWEGAADLVSLHDPLNYPDSSRDAFNFLRPLIGYGPESMYVAYNPFYPPMLGQVEKRNASPDRSHNETWDSLVITGWLGFFVYLATFISAFYFGMKWLGLVDGTRQRILFFGLASAGGIVGATMLILWGGIEWFGVGLPFGIAIGLLVYLGVVALVGSYRSPETSGEAARSMILISLIAAIMAHFLEINFGIAIVSTRTLFWVYAALLLLVGYVLPRHHIFTEESPQPASAEKAPAETRKSQASRSKRRRPERLSQGEWVSSWWSRALIAGIVLAIFLSALGFDYVSNSKRLKSTGEILVSSLTRLPNQNNAQSYGILALLLTTWVAGAVILTSEDELTNDPATWLKTVGLTGACSFVAAFFYWLWQAGQLSFLARQAVSDQQGLIEQVNRIGALLTNFYIYIFLLLLAFALVGLMEHARGERSFNLGIALLPVALLIVALLVNKTNLRVIHADIAFKMAEPFTTETQWPVATLLYTHAIKLAPNEDHYYLFLGRSYLEQAKAAESENEQQELVLRAESDLRVAQKVNPLNTDHTANLGRLYSWWASKSTDLAVRQSRGLKASEYYDRAVTLSPNNSTLWGEWAILFMDILQQPQEAFQRLSHASELDDAYSFTQGLFGDYYLRQAHSAGDEQARTQAYQQALSYYQRAASVAKFDETAARVSYLISAGNVHIQMAGVNVLDPQQITLAIESFSQAINANPGGSDVYRIEEQIARLYAQLGDKQNAVHHAQIAYDKAPTDQKESAGQLLAEISSLP